MRIHAFNGLQQPVCHPGQVVALQSPRRVNALKSKIKTSQIFNFNTSNHETSLWPTISVGESSESLRFFRMDFVG